MATATRKATPPPSPPPKPKKAAETPPERPPRIVRVFDAVFRFLASLKLAFISLSSLAAVLSFATFFEARHGTAAVQEYVYQTPWFAVILAFLGTNILCAALIRYPWKKRQTGFVITHAGLLVVLFGSWLMLKYADEGIVGVQEGATTAELIRQDYPVIRVRPIDVHTGQADHEYILPFRPGTFDWPEGRYEVLTDPRDPFKFAVKTHYGASIGRITAEPDPHGSPMLKLGGLFVKTPGSVTESDMLDSEVIDEFRWLAADNRFFRASLEMGPAAVAFQYLDTPEKVQEFLNPPQDPGEEGVARIYYTDDHGHARVHEFRLDDTQPNQWVDLPDSDLKAAFSRTGSFPLPEPSLIEMTGMSRIDLAIFQVRRGDGPIVEHTGYSLLPMIPSVLPDSESGEQREALVYVSYFHSPLEDGGRRMGLIEVAGDPDGRLYYRVFSREGLRDVGPLKKGEMIQALGGGGSPMSVRFSVDDYLTSARRDVTFEPLHLPVGQKDQGIAAARAEMTVDGETREFWIRRPGGLQPQFQTVEFPSGTYRVAYDVERRPLGFEVKLEKFEVGTDPGVRRAVRAASYQSDVLLTDESEGIKEKPVRISMNEPLTHNGWTLYQSNYIPLDGPDGQPSGEYISIFQARYDKVWGVTYFGCLLVVLGVFVQFYMRAGVFSDGGKREREWAAAKARKKAEREGKSPPPANDDGRPQPPAPKADDPL